MALTAQKKPPVHHRKRQAMHHSRNKRYLKAYWPYIPMLIIVVSGIGLNSLLIKNSQVLSVQQDLSRASLLNDTNAQRSQNSVPPLRFNSELNSAAQAKAEDMIVNNYWSHISPTGKTPWAFIGASGYQYQAAGENLAYGFNSADDVVKAWMNSPGHKANVLNKAYEEVGFGVAEANNYTGKGPEIIVVAEYAEPIIAVPNNTLSTLNPVLSASNSKPVSRIQLLTGTKSNLATIIVSLMTGAAIAIFVIRHIVYMRRLLKRSEKYIIKHPWLDIGFVLIATVGLLLSHTSGIIT